MHRSHLKERWAGAESVPSTPVPPMPQQPVVPQTPPKMPGKSVPVQEPPHGVPPIQLPPGSSV